MKRMVTIIGGILSVLALVVLVLAIMAPKHISIRSTALVGASQQEVFDQLRHLERFPKWSPFLIADPDQKYHVTGSDGAIGASFHWEGVAEQSKGKQTIMALVPNQRILMECEITEPYVSNPSFEYSLKQNPEGVELIQQFDLDVAFPTNIIAMMIGLKATMAATNQLGMDRFKSYVEGSSKVAELAH